MQLYKAKIYHTRFAPVKNSFTYKGFYFSFWLDEFESGEIKTPHFFSWRGFNLFSFSEKDHGFKEKGKSLKEWAQLQLGKAGIENFQGRVQLVTLPRILGYVFNPVSFWFCYEGDFLKAVIAEVNNTFGESHNYVVVDPLNNLEKPMEKVFHVSPFYPVQGQYRFNFAEENHVMIKYSSKQGEFIAGMVGEPVKMTSFIVPKLFFSYPLYTLWIVFLIHYQALKLYIKKVPFFRKPKPPTIGSSVYYQE